MSNSPNLQISDVINLVADVLQLGPRASTLSSESPLLGALPEFDSMAVVSIITAAEEELGVVIDEDAISAENFETVGSLHAFLAGLE